MEGERRLVDEEFVNMPSQRVAAGDNLKRQASRLLASQGNVRRQLLGDNGRLARCRTDQLTAQVR